MHILKVVCLKDMNSNKYKNQGRPILAIRLKASRTCLFFFLLISYFSRFVKKH